MGSASNKLRVFVLYDSEYDGDLYDLLVEQASQKASGFEISPRSRARPSTGLRYEQLAQLSRAKIPRKTPSA